LGEGVLYLLEGLRHAGVPLLPCSAQVYGQLLQLRFEDMRGVNLTLLNPYRFSPHYHSCATDGAMVMSDPFPVDVVDFSHTTQEAAMLPLPPVTITKTGIVSAVRMWFVLDFGDGGRTSLDSRDTHWKYAVQYVVEGRYEEGELVTGLSAVRQGAEYLFRLEGEEGGGGSRGVLTPRVDKAWIAAYQQMETQNDEILGR